MSVWVGLTGGALHEERAPTADQRDGGDAVHRALLRAGLHVLSLENRVRSCWVGERSLVPGRGNLADLQGLSLNLWLQNMCGLARVYLSHTRELFARRGYLWVCSGGANRHLVLCQEIDSWRTPCQPHTA